MSQSQSQSLMLPMVSMLPSFLCRSEAEYLAAREQLGQRWPAKDVGADQMHQVRAWSGSILQLGGRLAQPLQRQGGMQTRLHWRQATSTLRPDDANSTPC